MSAFGPSLGAAIGAALAAATTNAGAGGFSPLSLFAAGEQGAWYDPSDLSSMFQDAAGTTPVTAVEQPVGLLLDKRLGLARGPELNADSAVAGSIAGYTGPLTPGSGYVDLTNASAVGYAYMGYSIPGSAGGKYYEAITEIEVLAGSGGQGYWNGVGAAVFGNVSPAQGRVVQRQIIAAQGGSEARVAANPGVGNVVRIYSFSVRELPGNHATQATAAARPVVKLDAPSGLIYDKFDGVDDTATAASGGGGIAGFFFCGAVRATGGAGTTRQLFGDQGTNAGYRVLITSVNLLSLQAGDGAGYTGCDAGTLAVGTLAVVTVWDDGVNLNAQINNGTVVSVPRPVVTAGPGGLFLGSNGGGSFFTPMEFYGGVHKKNGGVTSTQREQVKQYLATKAGVVLP